MSLRMSPSRSFEAFWLRSTIDLDRRRGRLECFDDIGVIAVLAGVVSDAGVSALTRRRLAGVVVQQTVVPRLDAAAAVPA